MAAATAAKALVVLSSGNYQWLIVYCPLLPLLPKVAVATETTTATADLTANLTQAEVEEEEEVVTAKSICITTKNSSSTSTALVNSCHSFHIFL